MYKLKYLAAGLIIGTMLSSHVFAQAAQQFILRLADYPVLVRGVEYVSERLPLLNYNGTTYVPLRAFSEMLDLPVHWNWAQRRVEIGSSGDNVSGPAVSAWPSSANHPSAPHRGISASAFTFRKITLGHTQAEVERLLGLPARKDRSIHGFTWHIYNQSYRDYLQVGMQDNRVVALYSNSGNWRLPPDLAGSFTRDQVQAVWGQPLTGIIKENTRLVLGNQQHTATYLLRDCYVTFYYDMPDGGRIDAVMLVDRGTKEGMQHIYAVQCPELAKDFASQLVELTNVFRHKNGLAPLRSCDRAAAVARRHSSDMAARQYFSHLSPDGRTPFDRMRDGGIAFRAAAENIAYAQASAVGAFHAWLNSPVHRKAMLGSFELTGAGAAFDLQNRPFYTQLFYIGVK